MRLRQQLVSAKEAPAVRPEHADAAVLQVLEAREARVAELEEALAVLQSNTQELAAELAEEMAGAVVEKSAEQLMAMTQDLEVAADENAKLRQLLSMQKVSQPSDQTLDLDSQVACNGLQSIINSSVPATGRLRRQSTQSRLIKSRSHALNPNSGMKGFGAAKQGHPFIHAELDTWPMVRATSLVALALAYPL